MPVSLTQVTVEILDDTQYEPDEQFYLKLSLTGTKTIKQQDVMLGRISIMEVTVLNDDGQSKNKRDQSTLVR